MKNTKSYCLSNCSSAVFLLFPFLSCPERTEMILSYYWISTWNYSNSISSSGTPIQLFSVFARQCSSGTFVHSLYCLFQDSKAYYHLLNQIAPKGGDGGETAIAIDLSGLNVSVCKMLFCCKLSMYNTNTGQGWNYSSDVLGKPAVAHCLIHFQPITKRFELTLVLSW